MEIALLLISVAAIALAIYSIVTIALDEGRRQQCIDAMDKTADLLIAAQKDYEERAKLLGDLHNSQVEAVRKNAEDIQTLQLKISGLTAPQGMGRRL